MLNRACKLYGKGNLQIDNETLDELGESSVLVDMKRGGVCGSDIHYYEDGGIGTIRVSEPITLGHEVSGTIKQLGASVTSLNVGDRVAINPSQPCLSCAHCADGQQQHCINMQFMGSAKTKPHVQGGFRDALVVQQSQCYCVDQRVSFAEAACAEPLAVCLHAANQAGALKENSILVTGAGPIGSLCVAVAAAEGARSIVVTDLTDFTLDIAKLMGASLTINVRKSPDRLSEYLSREGQFDLAFECSGAKSAIGTAVSSVKPRGTIVQVGSAGEVTLPLNVLVGKEINLKGSMRFHNEFSQAVRYINDKTINIAPLITHTFPLADAEQAIHAAADRNSAMKVQLELGQNYG